MEFLALRIPLGENKQFSICLGEDRIAMGGKSSSAEDRAQAACKDQCSLHKQIASALSTDVDPAEARFLQGCSNSAGRHFSLAFLGAGI